MALGFPFRRRRDPTPETPPGEPSVFPALSPIASLGPPSAAQILLDMLAVLQGYLDPPALGLPDSSVTTVSVRERSVGLGNRRGQELVGPFAILGLKGGRLEALVRFQLWGSTLAGADNMVSELQGRLLADKDTLWSLGFLKFTQEATSLAEEISGTGWRKTTDFQVLYEYHYKDLDGAESIIARIPIHADQEVFNSPSRETTTVRDHIIRWDDLGATALEVAARGAATPQVSGLAILAYLPGVWTGNQVTLARLQEGNPAAPTIYPDLPTFVAAITDSDNPDRHAEVVLASVADLLAAFTPSGAPLPMGDWDEDSSNDEYLPGILAFAPPVHLAPNEILRISYQDPTFDTPAVVYLRAQVHGA